MMRLDDAYANTAYIPNGEAYFDRWARAAAAFREEHAEKELGVAYGAGARQWFDLYHPAGPAKGTVVFVHGGYWMACSPRDFSHLAAGALAAGYACAMPCYTLTPEARIAGITREIRAGVTAIAAMTRGSLYLAGHSAGGHLVARMGCADLAVPWRDRVHRIMPISPLSDLAPLMETTMNETLRLDPAEAQAESPIRFAAPKTPVTVWVGGDERPAFLDQAAWLARHWNADHVIDPGKHHFDVIEGMEQPDSPMMRALLE